MTRDTPPKALWDISIYKCELQCERDIQNPVGNRCFRIISTEAAGVPDGVDGGIRADSAGLVSIIHILWKSNVLGQIIGTVGERGSRGSEDLEEGEHVLGSVLVVVSVSVGHFEITGK